jgi:hypothetical protein
MHPNVSRYWTEWIVEGDIQTATLVVETNLEAEPVHHSLTKLRSMRWLRLFSHISRTIRISPSASFPRRRTTPWCSTHIDSPKTQSRRPNTKQAHCSSEAWRTHGSTRGRSSGREIT